MILSHSHRFVFLAFNKTGSTSIESVLVPHRAEWHMKWLRFCYRRRYDDVVFKHMDAARARGIVGARRWERYFTFAFVRNPWDRVVSLYHYHRQKNPAHWPLAQRPFPEWVAAGGDGTAQRSMREFVSDESGTQLVDFVGRYESLQEDLNTALQHIGLPAAELGWENRTTRGHYRDYYEDPATRRVVDDWVGTDAERFGYEF